MNEDYNSTLLYLNSEVKFDPNVTATWTNQNNTFPCTIDASQAEYIILNCTQPINGSILTNNIFSTSYVRYLLGTNQSVTIPFIPTISDDSMKGAYVSRFYEEDKKKYIVATQFEQGIFTNDNLRILLYSWLLLP